MKSNYYRVYSLTVGRPEKYGALTETAGVSFPAPPVSSPDPFTILLPQDDLDFTVIQTQQAIEIRDLQIRVTIKGNSETKGDSPTSTIKIFNLDEETRNQVSNKNNLVILKAGYEDDLGDPDDPNYYDLPTVFTGQVIGYKTENAGADIITTLTCSDGYTPKNTTKVSLSIDASNGNVVYKEVFDQLVNVWKQNGITVTDETLIFDAASTPPLFTNPNSELVVGGWSYEGYLADAMDDLCEHFNYTWHIVNNRLLVYPRDYKSFVSTYEFTDEVIKDIKPSKDNSKDDSIKADVQGVKLKTFLNARISVGNVIKVPTESYEGKYVVKNISHELDWRGNAWDTTLDLERV